MDLSDELKKLALRIEKQNAHTLTEEAVKTAFILPFIKALGYDIFDPTQVIPEFTADHGVKKGEKVDYAICNDGQINMLIEAKQLGAPLEAKHATQLFRYFSVTEARFAVLTDGARYVFYSDLEKPNQMDSKPFFEFNLTSFSDYDILELKKFSKSTFNLDTIISDASNLMYLKALKNEIRKEFKESPSEDLVKTLSSRVYSGRMTQHVKEQFTQLTSRALKEFIRDEVDIRIKSALSNDTEALSTSPSANPAISILPQEPTDDEIITTEDELKGFRIVQAICAEVVSTDKIFIRDAKSYCAILFDDNNRKSICRFYFDMRKPRIGINTPEGEKKYDMDRVEEIFNYRADILAAIKQYLD